MTVCINKCQNSETSKLWSMCARASNLISIHMEPHRLCKIELSPVTSSGMQQQDFQVYLLISNHSVCSFSSKLEFQRLMHTWTVLDLVKMVNFRVGQEHHREHNRNPALQPVKKWFLCSPKPSPTQEGISYCRLSPAIPSIHFTIIYTRAICYAK